MMWMKNLDKIITLQPLLNPWSTEIFNLKVPADIRGSRLKAYFTFNNWLSEIIQVEINHRMSTVVDISALRANFSLHFMTFRDGIVVTLVVLYAVINARSVCFFYLIQSYYLYV